MAVPFWHKDKQFRTREDKQHHDHPWKLAIKAFGYKLALISWRWLAGAG
jgi:hypothetical protein